jgi:hypothetical protein
MSIRIPSNQIITSKYTSGKEYMFKDIQKEYQGYYYELNGKKFAGKEFNPNANELVEININNVNTFLSRPSTLVYGLLSKIKLPPKTQIKSKPFTFNNNDFENGYKIRYFAKKLNQIPILIKEINEEEYKNLQSNPIYQVVSIKYLLNNNNDLNKFDKMMSGLGAFLSQNIIDTSSENDG